MTKSEFQEAVKKALPEGWRSLSETDVATDVWPILQSAMEEAKKLLFEVAFEDQEWTVADEDRWYERVRTLFPDIDKEPEY